jgi:tetratricopeptide (TPR) repeat protein
MKKWKLKTPVVFIIFNRPETTEKVFEQIRLAKPPKLLVVADGPRPGKPGEAEKCKAAREIVKHIDWECEILTNYSDLNLGCKRRVSTGLDWVFNTVEEAIILEDDCLPDPTFFRFCEELLEKYRDDSRIAQISGDNLLFGRDHDDYSYYFSRYFHLWGWATWRRAWKHYDVNMTFWPEIRDKRWLQDQLGNRESLLFWERVFENTYQGKIDSWDFQWVFSCWIQGVLSIAPSQNLVRNIGFGADATHTHIQTKYSNMETKEISFPLIHPRYMIRHSVADMIESLEEGTLIYGSDNIEFLHDFGILAFQKGKFELAAEFFLKMIKIKPDNAVAYNNLGVISYSMGSLDEAKECYEAALKFNPDYPEAHYNCGLIFRDRGKIQEALVAFEKAISLKSDYAEARNALRELDIKKSDRISVASVLSQSLRPGSALRKRMAYIGFGFHQRTKSTLALIEVLKKHFEVDIYWDNGNLDFNKIGKSGYDTVIFFQKIFGMRRLKSLNIKNLIMIPMYDDVLEITDYYWQQFDGVRILNFSKTLHEKLSLLGVESKYLQYYISPATLPEPIPNANCLSGFLWQRTNYVKWSTIKKLIENAPFDKIHLHSAVDPPNHIFERPSDNDIQKYKITISDWFPGKEEYLSAMNSLNVFFAPRLFEGIGMSFLEAMAMGKCVVAPNLPTMNEYIKHGENGLLYDPAKPVPLDFSEVDVLGMRARMSAEKGFIQWKERENELIEYISGEPVIEKTGLKEVVL